MIRPLLLFCLLFLAGFVSCGKPGNIASDNTSPSTSLDTTREFFFAKGADISWLTEMESAGTRFYDSSGAQEDCIQLLKSLGVNSIRLRVWVNPANGWCTAADMLSKAMRAKMLNMKILLDFHYSDSWADPGQQTKPAAWNLVDFQALKDSVSQHTSSVMNLLKSHGIIPDWVQVGNETNDGMLWPEGRASLSITNFAQLINVGYDAVKSVSPSSKVIIHISNGFDNNLCRWIFDGLKANSAKWDVIGLSLYPTSSNWTALNAQCLQNMNDIVSRYNKELIICEAGMSWDQPSASKNFISDLITKIKSIGNGKGLGVFYWEPEACNNWKGYTLGAFDNAGKPTAVLNAFR